MTDYVFRLFSSDEWVPRTHCGLWTADLMWMHLISDFLIWAAYMAIPILLVYLTFRRRDLPFHWIFWMFGLFIVSCGFTHFVELFAFTTPMYRLAGVVKAVTAIASVATVVSLWRVAPRVLAMPGLGEVLAGLDRETSQRQAAERQIAALNRDLRHRVDELQVLLDLTPVAIAFARDRECRDIAMNRACADLLGLPPGANASKSGPAGAALPFRVTMDGVELAPDELPMQRAAATGTPVAGVTVQLERADGRVFHLLENASPLFDERGEVRGCVAAFVDISDRVADEQHRRELEAGLLDAQKRESLGALAGGVAHDFNNLLVGVLGNAELALETVPPGSPAATFIGRIERSAHLAANLTRQMLAYSGKGRFVIESLDLSKLVGDMIALLEATISKKATLHCEFDPDLPPIEADRGQISQVVMNLLVNASEAIGDRAGKITLRTRRIDASERLLSEFLQPHTCRPGTYASLEIADDGCGMPPDVLAQVFEPFYSTKFAGRGLGLAAVQGIVRAHGGALRVESSVGAGATFTLLFPLAAEPSNRPDAPSPGQSRSPEPQERATVLIADDEPVVCEIVRQVLENAGYNVLVANDGVEAVETVRNGSAIDAVLLDLTMPRMGGLEAFREIRRIHPAVPVVLSSGYTSHDSIDHAETGPPAAFLAKPFSRDTLLTTIASVVGSDSPRGRRGSISGGDPAGPES